MLVAISLMDNDGPDVVSLVQGYQNGDDTIRRRTML